MSNCGKCKKPVAASDVTCPHCDALLAAYAPPPGVETPIEYQIPDEPEPYVAPEVEMEVKPPSETEVVTDPNEVVVEPVSTAPQPLFDTYLTVEEIARAAEGDHSDDVVTISDKEIETRTVEFEVPDYARPPADAAPIPTIDEDDESIPLITQDDGEAGTSTSSETRDDDPAPPPSNTESWLYASPSRGTPNPKGTAVAEKAADSNQVGTTDAYVSTPHSQTGHGPAPAAPVALRPVSLAARSRRDTLQSPAHLSIDTRDSEAREETLSNIIVVFWFAVFLMWFFTLVVIMSGNAGSPFVFATIIVTWQRNRILKFLESIFG